MPTACKGKSVPLSILTQKVNEKSQSFHVFIVWPLNRFTNKQGMNAKLKSNALFPFSFTRTPAFSISRVN